MPGIGFKTANTWAAASASDTVSASTTFVNPQFYPGADSIEVAFTQITKGASDAATVDLWYRGYDEDGSQKTVLWDETVANFSASSTSDVAGRTVYTNVPAGEWYAQLVVTSGSGAGFTGSALIRYVDSTEIRSTA